MAYFVTGATGFIGKFLLQRLLDRKGHIHVLVRPESKHKFEELLQRYPGQEKRIKPVYGDLTQPGLGLDEKTLGEQSPNHARVETGQKRPNTVMREQPSSHSC